MPGDERQHTALALDRQTVSVRDDLNRVDGPARQAIDGVEHLERATRSSSSTGGTMITMIRRVLRAVGSIDHLPLPGVTVTVASPALQGEREVLSDSNGIYHMTGLPAGTYSVAFAISGFQSATREGVQVNIGAIASIDATMSLQSITETVTVTAQLPSPLNQASTTQAQSKRNIDVL